MINGKEIFFDKKELAIWELAYQGVESHLVKNVCIHCKKDYDETRKISYACLFNGNFVWWHKKNCLPYQESSEKTSKKKKQITMKGWVTRELTNTGKVSKNKFAEKFGSDTLPDIIYILRNDHMKVKTVVIVDEDTLYVTEEFLKQLTS